ncbi:anti-sigma factor [Streptomyces sp. NPDC058000]|uniref:anti-sigma factor n=1 Tax=Streptomyces sp. NPDC058000 TaxID=3346299 RepID=UPI0036E3B4D7
MRPSPITGCPTAQLPSGRVYQLWYSRNGWMVPAGLVETGRASGAMLLTGGVGGADGVGVTAEPHGGSTRPTSASLALLSVQGLSDRDPPGRPWVRAPGH